jgi:(1->4)-alpha-D-glucan 1-alpha-D-glucosylmutase
VRARLAVLSEIPAEFGDALHRWSRRNNELRAELKLGEYPDRNTEYMLYQTLIGAWPITAGRVQEYMLKATREAKQKTTWTANNGEFEDALHKFIDAILQRREFVTDLEQFVMRVQDAGRANSLAQTLMKHTSHGVPDLYQGSEIWDLSLVDPDNRRPVDYRLRAKMLHEIKRMPADKGAAEAMRRAEEGLPKLWTIHQALCVRRERPNAFGVEGNYQPLGVAGKKAGHGIAYLRGNDVATIVPRWTAMLSGKWDGTAVELPPGTWTNRLTGASLIGGRIAMGEVLRDFPVALLVKD